MVARAQAEEWWQGFSKNGLYAGDTIPMTSILESVSRTMGLGVHLGRLYYGIGYVETQG